MKNSFLKKLMAVLLTALVAFSVLSVSVFAEEIGTGDEKETVTDETATDETVTDETATDETVTDETVTDTDKAETSGFQPMNFVKNLKYMGVGMLCIILVMGVLIGATVLLNKVTAPKDEKKD